MKQMKTPLQIIVIRDRANHRTDVYMDTLRLAFEGSSESETSPGAYLSESVDLGIRVLGPMGELGKKEANRLLLGARHTILVLIGDPPGREVKIEEMVEEDNVQRVTLPVEVVGGEIQGEKLRDGIEPAIAPVVATLLTMERARRVLFQRIKQSNGSLKLFISHAKFDGVAVAKSLIGLLRELQNSDGEKTGFDYFYDAEHIEPGSLWRDVLKTESGQSMLIALRTEAYESRFWCRQEFLQAERNGMPILVVDLRKEQYHDSALLPFDVAPVVRVHDGNLIRIVLHAMAAHLRALRVRSEAPSSVKVLPHRPSVYSLDGRRQGAKVDKIAYPGPRLSEVFTQAVQPMLSEKGAQTVELVTYDEIGVL